MRNRNKLKALVHYVAWKCDDPNVLGAIKLNKVLWVSDLWTYVGSGVPLTGERYVKRQFGPVSQSVLGIVGELENEQKIVVRNRETYGYEKTDYIALKEPDISCFSSSEISLIDEAIDFVCYEHTAKEISERSHDIIWQLADLGEEIPYSAMLAVILDEVTPEDVSWAREVLEAA